MNKEEITDLAVAFANNEFAARHEPENIRSEVAVLATMIDYLRGDIDGIKPVANEQNNVPKQDNADPDKLATETMKRLGELGLQSLNEIKGYNFDSNGRFLLFINGRFADTGWTKGDPHIDSFMTVCEQIGIAPHNLS